MLHDYTHVLLANDYTDALRAIVAETLPRVENAYVLLDHDELDGGFDPAVPSRKTWTTVQDAFEPVDGPGPFPEEAVDVPASERMTCRDTHTGCTAFQLVGDPAALEQLCTLADEPVVGQWFLQQVRLTSGRDVVLGAVPHHQKLWIDADAFQKEYVNTLADALVDYQACLVSAGTRLEWSVDGRTYRLTGGSLCVESDSGLTGDSCWGLTRLDSVRKEGTELVLTWESDERPFPVQVLSSGLRTMLPGASIPKRVPCKDPETTERACELLTEMLAAYERG